MGNPAEGAYYTLMSVLTPGALTTSPDTGIDAEDDVDSGVSPHGTNGSLSHRAASVVVGVVKEEHK